MDKIGRFFWNLYSDGYRAIGLVAPLASVATSLAKWQGVTVGGLQHISWAWVLAPTTAWLFVAYIRRFTFSENEIETERGKNQELLDEYPYALRLINIDVSDERQLNVVDSSKIISRNVRIVLRWKNSISRPIWYKVLKTTVNEKALPVSEIGEVISGNSETNFYTAWFNGDLPVDENMKEIYYLALEVIYGRPNVSATRRILKQITITAFHKSGRTSYINIVDTDEPAF